VANARFCPGCGRPVQTLPRHETAHGPRTDRPLTALPGRSETRVDILEVARFLPARYRPVRKLGQGGMGTVYLCQDLALDRPVAVKILTDRYRADPQGERRFVREARAQATVNHPNVATVLNFGVSPEGHPFLVMEYLEGENLRTLLRREKTIEPFKACELLHQMCEGLAEAHGAGLVHRDLKPSNIMIVKDHRGKPRVKILDLGLAKIIGGQSDLKSISLDTAGMLVGTPAYMSPEQVAGNPVDGRADIYSMGVVLFEMLTGRLVFESETMEGWLYQHLHANPPPPSQYNSSLLQYPVLDCLTLRMLAKQPDDRPPSASELARIIERAVALNLAGEAELQRPAPEAVQRPASAAEETQPLAGPAKPPAAAAAAPALETPPPDHAPLPAPAQEARLSAQTVLLETEARRDRYLELAREAEATESARQWQKAIERWAEAVRFADRAETVQARIEGCRREAVFEEQLQQAVDAGGRGDWEAADKALARLSSSRPSDARVEQVRARLPRHLVTSWLGLAKAKVLALPEGDLRQALLEHLGIAYAQGGDMQSALDILQDASRKPEARVVGLAQAVCAAVQNGLREGLRPYLDRTSAAASSLGDPSERGRAQVEIARALSAYGDLAAAGVSFHNALNAFSEANAKGIPMQGVARRTTSTSLRRLAIDLRSVAVTTTGRTGPKALRADWEAAVGVVAQAQAEAGLVDDSLASAALIEDAWTLAHTFSQVAQALAKTGRSEEAERVISRIGFALPKARALRALAVSRVYGGDIMAAEEILKAISAPHDRVAIEGLLAAAWALRAESNRARFRVTEAVRNIPELVGARARFQALIAAGTPLLNAGFQELAEPLVGEAPRLIELMDDPAERLRSMLELAQAQETPQSMRHAATRTMIASRHPGSEFGEWLRRALMVWRQVRKSGDRLECVERLAYSIAWGSAPELATEVLSTCQHDSETALAYIGLSTGMA